jgi:hypothetical protein
MTAFGLEARKLAVHKGVPSTWSFTLQLNCVENEPSTIRICLSNAYMSILSPASGQIN